MKQEETKKLSTKEKRKALFLRLAIALVALVLGALLILWDMGWIKIPFLPNTQRREPMTQTQTAEEETEEVVVTDWKAFAKKAIGTFHYASLLDDPASFVTNGIFNRKTMSVLKTELKNSFIKTEMGYVQDKNGAVYLASDLTKLPESEGYFLTYYRAENGSAIFEKKDSSGYFTFDAEALTWVNANFDPKVEAPQPLCPTKDPYGTNQGNTSLICENGLYGYTGWYRDARSRKQTFTVPSQYTKAFPYSENLAVMADDKGKVTIRNERGEVVFSHLNLVLPEKSGVEGLGYTHFEHGVLRVIFATYDGEGKLTETREGIINAKGQEISLPQGYRAVSYHEGFFVLTNGERWGYLTSTGAWLTDPVFQNCQPFFEGLAVVTGEGGKVGLIDREGKTVLACAFDSISNFSEGYALLKDQYVGTFLLSKAEGAFENLNEEVPPSVSSFQTKVTITRGPQNTFDHEDDIIIEFPQVSTSSRKPHPEFWESGTTTTTTKAPPTSSTEKVTTSTTSSATP